MADPTTPQASTGAQGTASNAAANMDFSLAGAVERVHSWVDGATRLLPNLVVAVVVVLVFYAASLLVLRLIKESSRRKSRENLGDVLGSFVKWAIVLLGVLLAATVVIPSLNLGDLVAGLGVGSVAIGFAFKDILQNWLAGLLLLMRQPFHIGDQIEVNGREGTVERIETRATIIKTFDGQRIVVPNNEIYSNSVRVMTAHDLRRSEYDIGIGYGDGIEEACSVIAKALRDVPQVQTDPAPQVLPWDLAASWVTLRVRWWTKSTGPDLVASRAAVITAMKAALDKAGIDMPYDTQVHLFHDQTESEDGVRGNQREGWPAPKQGRTEARWKVQQRQAIAGAAKSGEAAGDPAGAGAGVGSDKGHVAGPRRGQAEAVG